MEISKMTIGSLYVNSLINDETMIFVRNEKEEKIAAGRWFEDKVIHCSVGKAISKLTLDTENNKCVIKIKEA